MAVHTAISLCSGVGMLDHGVELAHRLTGRALVPLLYVEKEAVRAANLVWQMEEGFLAPAPIWSDVNSVAGAECNRLLEEDRPGLLFGGIPCQPHSQAGKRLGDDDPRDLWPATRRAVEVYEPRRVFIENVSGICLANEPDGGAARMVLDLERMGYRSTFGFFGSEECGASHGRLRWFLMADRENERPQGRGTGHRRERLSGPGSGELAPGSSAIDLGRAGSRYAPPRDAWGSWLAVARTRPDLLPAHGRTAAQCELLGMADGLADRAHRLSAVGDGVDSLAAAYAFLSLEACLD